MPLRIPPGRAGRTWLVGRLEVAHRGAELLERKRQALLAELARVRVQADQARLEWHEAASEMQTWTVRAAVVDGPARLELLARHVGEKGALELSWHNLMGARIPRAESVDVPDPPPVSALGGSSAAVLLAGASANATRAAVRCAVAERAEAELSDELTRTARRLRALRTRWIPQHEQALAALDLALDEAQREQAIRVRWLTERHGPAASAS
jgi:V/A-type H+/Na+-transporting ATPase subunit D